ncbi:MAG: adenylate kinase family protein [Candidatus Thorarchaeota archaeon]
MTIEKGALILPDESIVLLLLDCYASAYILALKAVMRGKVHKKGLIYKSFWSQLMKSFLIGGTPGTGKTEIARVVAAHFNKPLIAIGDLARDGGCISEHDKDRETDIIDEDCLVNEIINELELTEIHPVIEGHYIDLVPSEFVEKVFILRTHPDTLKKRLLERDYPANKVKENIEAEIIGVCQMDALDSFGEANVFEIDTSELNVEEAAEKLLQLLKDDNEPIRIDWMEMLEAQGILDQYLSE